MFQMHGKPISALNQKCFIRMSSFLFFVFAFLSTPTYSNFHSIADLIFDREKMYGHTSNKFPSKLIFRHSFNWWFFAFHFKSIYHQALLSNGEKMHSKQQFLYNWMDKYLNLLYSNGSIKCIRHIFFSSWCHLFHAHPRQYTTNVYRIEFFQNSIQKDGNITNMTE